MKFCIFLLAAIRTLERYILLNSSNFNCVYDMMFYSANSMLAVGRKSIFLAFFECFMFCIFCKIKLSL